MLMRRSWGSRVLNVSTSMVVCWEGPRFDWKVSVSFRAVRVSRLLVHARHCLDTTIRHLPSFPFSMGVLGGNDHYINPASKPCPLQSACVIIDDIKSVTGKPGVASEAVWQSWNVRVEMKTV
jgi:hypothetical protein